MIRDIIMIMVFATFFEAYSFAFIGTFPVTPVTVIISIGMIFKLINIKSLKVHINKSNLMALLIIILAETTFIIKSDSSITALLLVFMFFIFYIISYRTVKEETFNKFIHLFTNCIFVFAIYAIYQFIGRLYDLPFTDLKIENHMVQGFNWTNSIIISGKSVFRSNSIFREPSIFSRNCSLALAFVINELINEKKKISVINLLKIIVYIVAIILSFSGAPFWELLIFVAFIFYRSKYKIKKGLIMAMSLLAIIIIGASFVNYSDLLSYFYSRFAELGSSGTSGSLRYVAPFDLLMRSLEVNPILGFGIGSKEKVIELLGNGIAITQGIDSTLPRIGMELGLTGIVLYVFFIFLTFKKSNGFNNYYIILWLFVLAECFNGEMFLQTMLWPYLYLLNCTLVREKASDIIIR